MLPCSCLDCWRYIYLFFIFPVGIHVFHSFGFFLFKSTLSATNFGVPVLLA
uniref:Uncharacterized protein n=1 Tax=Rhizophora mucronata TaxID=61149 RepID=A0A2P2QR80_RHIMU